MATGLGRSGSSALYLLKVWKLQNCIHFIVHWDSSVLEKRVAPQLASFRAPQLSAHLICKCVANVWQTQQKYVEQASFSSSLSTKDNVLVDELRYGPSCIRSSHFSIHCCTSNVLQNMTECIHPLRTDLDIAELCFMYNKLLLFVHIPYPHHY